MWRILECLPALSIVIPFCMVIDFTLFLEWFFCFILGIAILAFTEFEQVYVVDSGLKITRLK